MNEYLGHLEDNVIILYVVEKEVDDDGSAVNLTKSDVDLISLLENNKLQYKTIKLVPKLEERIDSPNHFFVKDKDYFRKIYFDQILWIEAAGSYCYIHINESVKKICVSFTLSEIISQLPANQFIQTHRSYIVNIDRVDSFIGNTICIGVNKIPISKKMRSNIIKRLNILGKMGL